jgi:hypothetical protein
MTVFWDVALCILVEVHAAWVVVKLFSLKENSAGSINFNEHWKYILFVKVGLVTMKLTDRHMKMSKLLNFYTMSSPNDEIQLTRPWWKRILHSLFTFRNSRTYLQYAVYQPWHETPLSRQMIAFPPYKPMAMSYMSVVRKRPCMLLRNTQN